MVDTLEQARALSAPPHDPPWPHVLVSAYMCEPDRGSEPGKSWNWVTHLAQHCRVSVITQPGHRPAIEANLKHSPQPNLHFHYVSGPAWLRVVKYDQLRYHMNYMAWQRLALERASRLLTSDPFDLVHHICFASITRPIFMQELPVPLIFGPVGGGELGHSAFWKGGGMRARAYEWLRTTRMRLLRWDPLVQSTLRGAARIYITTPENRRFVPPAYHHKLMVTASSGIESALTRQPMRGSDTGQRIYSAGRLLHWKGFHLAIAAFARVARRFPNATLTIIGDGPQRARLQHLIEQAGLAARVRIEHWLPRAEVLRIAAESDLFLFPSLHDSGGMAVLEAMANAKPVVCLDSGGPGVMVTPVCGIKVPLTTPDEAVIGLADGLARLLADEPLRRQMGMAARRRVLDEYIWERKTADMVGVYRDLLTEPTGRLSQPKVAQTASHTRNA
jgi:glycosyltransferase involved in cell wall biosynthesis